MTDERPLELGRPSDNSQPFTVGTPDLSGEWLTLKEAEERGFGSASGLKKLALKGKLPGAEKKPGPNGTEWRVPLASLESRLAPATSKPTEEIETLRQALEAEKKAKETAEALLEAERRIAEVQRQERDTLIRTVESLTSAIETLNRALPPARPEPTVAMAIEQNLRTPTFVGGGEGDSSIEQALSNPRGWLARRRAKKNAS